MPKRIRRPLVLVVEDDFAIRKELAELLEDVGYQVASAHDGLDALSYLEAQRTAGRRLPAAIVTDLMMARMDGRELIRRLREDRGLAAIPVMVISAAGKRALDGVEAEARFSKPIQDWTSFLETLRRLVTEGPRGRRTSPPDSGQT